MTEGKGNNIYNSSKKSNVPTFFIIIPADLLLNGP